MRTLDSCYNELSFAAEVVGELAPCLDFLKVDCEGYELQVLQGAERTLRLNNPCVIVEQKQHIMSRNYGTSGTPAVDFLLSLGAVVRKTISGDWILSWD